SRIVQRGAARRQCVVKIAYTRSYEGGDTYLWRPWSFSCGIVDVTASSAQVVSRVEPAVRIMLSQMAVNALPMLRRAVSRLEVDAGLPSAHRATGRSSLAKIARTRIRIDLLVDLNVFAADRFLNIAVIGFATFTYANFF